MEFLLFAGIGSLAIIAAVAMLISENAVHSALFLIGNFLCVAFLYLMLEAPFLAMVQIAVYAGAIMVLFLFVIMLLGAERLKDPADKKRLGWVPGIALALGLSFLFSVGAAISSGRIGTAPAPTEDAVLQVIHAAPPPLEAVAEGANEARAAITERRFDIYVDGVLEIEGLTFGAAGAEYAAAIPAGEHTIQLSPAGTDVPLKTATVNVESGQALTVVLHGVADADLALTAVEPFDAVVARNTADVKFFNALPDQPSVDIVDVQSELFDNSRRVLLVAENIPYGSSSDAVTLNLRDATNWTIIDGGASEKVLAGDRSFVIAPLNALDTIDYRSERAYLTVISGLRALDGSLQPTVIKAQQIAPLAFGSPQVIGNRLFIDYALPMQLVAILLLAAMVGVIVLTVREELTSKPSRSQRRKVSRPLTSVIAAQTGTNVLSDAPQLTAPQGETPGQTEPAGD